MATFQGKPVTLARDGKCKTVDNQDRAFGSHETYQAVYLEFNEEIEGIESGNVYLFTETQIKDALARSKKNLEDLPPIAFGQAPKKKSIWSKIFFFLG